MKRTALPGVLSLLPALVTSAVLPAANAPQEPDIKDLMEKLERSETAVRSVSMKLTTEGRHPSGQPFQSEGEIRVLRGTHFHVTLRFRFSEQLEGESETVRTPEGVWIRDKGPAFGEVFLEIPGPKGEPDGSSLMEQLDEAARLLGPDASVLGAFDSRSLSPLGSRMLRDLDERYDLEVQKRASLGSHRGYRVGGDLRDDVPAAGPVTPDRVELFIREHDGAVLEMVQFRDGVPLTKVRIEELELDKPMEPESFTLDAGGKTFRSVREHPPAWASIEQVLEQARAIRNRGCYRLGFVPRDDVRNAVQIQVVDRDLRKNQDRGERLFIGDVVQKVNGEPVTTAQEINEIVDGIEAGETVTLEVLRGTEESQRTISVPILIGSE